MKLKQNIHHAIKTIKIKNLKLIQKFNLIIQTTKKFIIEKKNLKHKNQKLQTALVNKKKQKKTKSMELFTENELK